MSQFVTMLLAGTVLLALPDVYRSARSGSRWSISRLAPTAARLDQIRALFTALGRQLAPGAPPPALVAKARQAGLELTRGRDQAGELWIIREPARERRGDGLFALRPGGAPLCIQAPHTFFDRGTGEAALALFSAVRASCLCVNTIHRRWLDVAHAEASIFQAATEGLVHGVRWPLLQLHGFGQRSGIAADAVAVLSEGNRAPKLAAKLQQLIQKAYGHVLLYPRDTRMLGGTANRQGRCARAAGVTFMHMEMSLGLRETLRQKPKPLAEALRTVLKLP